MARKRIEQVQQQKVDGDCPKCQFFTFGKWENRGFIVEKKDHSIYDYVAIPCPICSGEQVMDDLEAVGLL